MTTIPKLFLITAISFFSCTSKAPKPGDETPLIAKDSTKIFERTNTLFVFVGKKISVTPLPHEQGSMDAGFRAKCRIIQRVYGHHPGDIIEFTAYDHYGTPKFSQYEHALLYVSEYEGTLYHEKYQYDPLYKTKDGRWAGPYSDGYDHDFNKHTTIKPEKIEFDREVSLPVKIRREDGVEYTYDYPEPYYKTVGNKAFIVYGNYVKELFQLKKDGVLTARKVFGDKEIEIEPVELAKPPDTTGNKQK